VIRALITRTRAVVRPVVVPAIVLLIWHLVSANELVSPVFLPAPHRVYTATLDMWRDGTLSDALTYTLVSALVGWLIACILGVILAIAITRSQFLVDALAPPLDFARSVPAAALIPPATLLFGYGRAMELPVIVAGAIWPVLLNAIHGILASEPQLHEVARSIRLSRTRRVWSIELPSALPAILLGVRTALSVAVIVAVVAEMVGASGGLGYKLVLAGQRFQSGSVYSLVLVLGAIGVLANALVYGMERRILSGAIAPSPERQN